MLFLFVYYVFIETKQCYLKEINMNAINTEQLRKEINKTNASLFRVSFVKANGENRTMYAKIGIKRFLSKRPNKKVVKNVNQDIVRVFDCQSKSYKSFKLSSVTEFVGNNKVLK